MFVAVFATIICWPTVQDNPNPIVIEILSLVVKVSKFKVFVDVDVNKSPFTPDVPEVPDVPDEPGVPDIPCVPFTPDVPLVPDEPAVI